LYNRRQKIKKKIKTLKEDIDKISKNFALKNIKFLHEIQTKKLQKFMPQPNRTATNDDNGSGNFLSEINLFVEIKYMMQNLSRLHEEAAILYSNKMTKLQTTMGDNFVQNLEAHIEKFNAT
jgi:hypothetical protein